MLGTGIDHVSTMVMFARDNVDHNILTIDGKGTFHGTRMKGALISGQKSEQDVSRHMTADFNIAEESTVMIVDYKLVKHIIQNVKFVELPLFP